MAFIASLERIGGRRSPGSILSLSASEAVIGLRGTGRLGAGSAQGVGDNVNNRAMTATLMAVVVRTAVVNPVPTGGRGPEETATSCCGRSVPRGPLGASGRWRRDLRSSSSETVDAGSSPVRSPFHGRLHEPMGLHVPVSTLLPAPAALSMPRSLSHGVPLDLSHVPIVVKSCADNP
jgi:hypothetical protein